MGCKGTREVKDDCAVFGVKGRMGSACTKSSLEDAFAEQTPAHCTSYVCLGWSGQVTDED